MAEKRLELQANFVNWYIDPLMGLPETPIYQLALQYTEAELLQTLQSTVKRINTLDGNFEFAAEYLAGLLMAMPNFYASDQAQDVFAELKNVNLQREVVSLLLADEIRPDNVVATAFCVRVPDTRSVIASELDAAREAEPQTISPTYLAAVEKEAISRLLS